MTEETFTRAKDPDDLDASIDPEQAELVRVGQVWTKLAKREGINADMLVATQHTDTDYVFIIDREQVAQ